MSVAVDDGDSGELEEKHVPRCRLLGEGSRRLSEQLALRLWSGWDLREAGFDVQRRKEFLLDVRPSAVELGEHCGRADQNPPLRFVQHGYEHGSPNLAVVTECRPQTGL